MMEKFWCKLGCHFWYDEANIQNGNGCFEVQKCMHCTKLKVFKEYNLNGQTRLHILNGHEVPKSVQTYVKNMKL